MDAPNVDRLAEWLNARYDCAGEPGLNEAELRAAEDFLGFSFPPIWRAVLRRVHPVDKSPPRPGGRWPTYPDWRLRDPAMLRERLDAPVEGLLFDVEHNNFWWHAWGAHPATLANRLKLARLHLRQVPRLFPILSHWYAAPLDDSSVFSIVQADLYIPAVTLADLATGKSQDQVDSSDWPIGNVPFWSELHAWSQVGHFDERFAGLGSGGL